MNDGINMGNTYFVVDPEKVRKIINNQCAIDATIRRTAEKVEKMNQELRDTQYQNAALLNQLIELLKPISHHFEQEYKEWCKQVREEELKAGIGVDIENLELSVRGYNCLKRAGLGTIDKVLAEYKRTGLRKVRNLGRRTLCEIKEKLIEYGYISEEKSDNGGEV